MVIECSNTYNYCMWSVKLGCYVDAEQRLSEKWTNSFNYKAWWRASHEGRKKRANSLSLYQRQQTWVPWPFSRSLGVKVSLSSNLDLLTGSSKFFFLLLVGSVSGEFSQKSGEQDKWFLERHANEPIRALEDMVSHRMTVGFNPRSLWGFWRRTHAHHRATKADSTVFQGECENSCSYPHENQIFSTHDVLQHHSCRCWMCELSVLPFDVQPYSSIS
jgi:hypothetical protein